MSVQDMIKKSILKSENFTSQNAVKILATLLLAIALGAFIYFVYQRFFTGVVYSRSFAMTLVGMSILTAMVTLAISTNVVISLGMVGALSIVRYRTAVKDPMDLLYLFWAITTGITVGAGMYILAIVTAVVIFGMLLVFSRMQHQGKVYIVIIHYQGDETGDRIIQSFGKIKYFVKSKTLRGDTIEMAVEVLCKKEDFTFVERIRNLERVSDVTLIQYNGEYHG